MNDSRERTKWKVRIIDCVNQSSEVISQPVARLMAEVMVGIFSSGKKAVIQDWSEFEGADSSASHGKAVIADVGETWRDCMGSGRSFAGEDVRTCDGRYGGSD